jgi:hypothetical protein
MKLRNFTLILFFITLSDTLLGQKGGTISIGATPGLSYMLAQNAYYLADNTKELDYKPKFSYHIFVQGGYNFKEQHGIVAFANYCDEGQKYKDEFKYRKYPSLIGTHEKSVDFKYMGFGVLYRFAPLLSGQKQHIRTDEFHWRMKLLAGFEADFLLNAQMTYKITPPGGTAITEPYPIDPAIGGYSAYQPNGSDNYKSYFKTLQGVAVLRYGFDYIFSNNLFIGIALETKFGLNDINAKSYRVHPEYKKSKNYFFGLNVEVGYVFKKQEGEEATKKKSKTKDKGVDLNRRVDKVDKGTIRRMQKGR